MKFLLDTHLLLWAAEGAGLSERALQWIEAADSELIFSAASIWEIAIKASVGRADFQVDASLFRRALLDSGYQELAVSGVHAARVASLPPIHRDPFDRLLIAQAISEGVSLLTADRAVLAYPGPILDVS